MSRSQARTELLDAAERLFALEGISTVSDRRVADVAGNTNHSAVRYYFGGREGLLKALLERHIDQLEPTRRQRFLQSETVVDDIRALVVPLTDAFAAMPVPSFRARFFEQAQHDPPTVELLRGSIERAVVAGEITASLTARLAHLDHRILRARAGLMAHLIGAACAELEARAERSGTSDEWADAADFLCDAVSGMLQAPITAR